MGGLGAGLQSVLSFVASGGNPFGILSMMIGGVFKAEAITKAQNMAIAAQSEAIYAMFDHNAATEENFEKRILEEAQRQADNSKTNNMITAVVIAVALIIIAIVIAYYINKKEK